MLWPSLLDVPEPVITASGLVKRFGDFTAVDGIDFEVAPGEAFGLLGPNGAGKSTTITLRDFFDQAPNLNENAALIRGTICGYKVQEIPDPLMQKIRYLDLLVDEVARGKKMTSILRGS